MNLVEPARRAAARDLVDECENSFRAALQNAPTRSESFSIADLTVTLTFAGDTTPPRILPALAHRASASRNKPELNIRIWDDTQRTGVLPRLPWNGELVTRRGDIQGFGTEAIHATLDREHEILSAADTRQGIGYYFVRDVRRFPPYEVAAPMRPLLYWLLRSRDRFLLHAGAVGDENGAVLLAGKGGSGKSTTALACLESDLYYLADDYCIVSGSGPARVWNLYNSAKATPKTLELVPFLPKYLDPNLPRVNDKAVLFLDRINRQKIADCRPIKAIVLPRVTNAVEPRLSPAPRAALMGALSISTMIQLPGAGNEILAAIQTLTDRVPCFYLELGSNTRAIPKTIQTLLASRRTLQ